MKSHTYMCTYMYNRPQLLMYTIIYLLYLLYIFMINILFYIFSVLSACLSFAFDRSCDVMVSFFLLLSLSFSLSFSLSHLLTYTVGSTLKKQ